MTPSHSLPSTEEHPFPPPASPAPATAILHYLQHQLPNWPFEPDLDAEFIDELLRDYPHLNVLEEIKVLRWYHNNAPPWGRQPRAYLRRWIARARPQKT